MMEKCKQAFKGTNVHFIIASIHHDSPLDNVPWSTHSNTFSDLIMPDEKGMVHVFMVDTAQGKNGDLAGMYIDKDCESFILLTDDRRTYTFVHEIGHYYGLDHMPKDSNIMHNGIRTEPKFTKEQMRSMIRRMKKLTRSCR